MTTPERRGSAALRRGLRRHDRHPAGPDRRGLATLAFPPLHKWLLLVSLTVVGATGFAWFALRDVLDRDPGDFDRWLLVAHGVFASATTMGLGSVLAVHVRLGLRARRHLPTGLAFLATLAALVATGLGLYYGDLDSRAFWKWSHVAIGIFGTAAGLAHIPLRGSNLADDHS